MLRKKDISNKTIKSARKISKAIAPIMEPLEGRQLFSVTFSENFEAYTGAGFSPSPTTGQLDSNLWAATGWSDGALAFGGIKTTGDYARGTDVAGGVTTGGFYQFTVGTPSTKIFGIQPGGSDWAPGTVTLKLQNDGTALSGPTVAYDLWVNNDQARSNSFNFSYSTDGTNFTSVTTGSFAYTSTAAADANGFVKVATNSTTLTGVNIAANGFLYLRWSGADVGGSGSRDEFGIDNVTVSSPAVGVSTTTALTSVTPTTVNLGDNVTFSGTVVAGSGSTTPTGTVEIRNGGASGTLLASTTTIGGTDANGTFSINSTTVPIGTFSQIQAFYVPSGSFIASSSGVFGSTLTVNGVAAPAITTPTHTAIATTTATLGGTVTAENGATVTERGIVYSLTSANADPTIGGTGVTKVIEGGTGTGVFTVSVTGLTSESAYTFKAYATNSVGTTYTTVDTFTTTPNLYKAISTAPLTQDWTNTGLITADDNWSGVPNIRGYRGDNLTIATGVDPQTILSPGIDPTDNPAGVLDVNANQTNPDTFFSGGVAEFALADPTIALAGSGTADAPFIVLYADATGVTTGVRVQYDVRDIETTDNAVQAVALQYRIGETGDFINVPGGYIADATDTGATKVTHVDAVLPPDTLGASQIQIRIITSNAVGNDEWVGIDNINVSPAPVSAGTIQFVSSAVSASESVGNYVIQVSRTGGSTGEVSATYAITPGSAQLTTDYTDPGTTTVTWAEGDSSVKTISIPIINDAAQEPSEDFSITLLGTTGGATLGTNTTVTATITNDDPIYAALASGPLTQSWGDTTPFTANDDWSPIPSIIGFTGADNSTTSPIDPSTITDSRVAVSDTPPGEEDVNFNQTDPNTFFTGGVAYFSGANVGNNGTIALAGSNAADAPFLLLHVDTTGLTRNVEVKYKIRDLETTDNAKQQVALQYRIGNTGNFIDVPSAFVDDATDEGNTKVTSVDAILPISINGNPFVQFRIITGNVIGNDEWVGIDDIVVQQAPEAPGTFSMQFPTARVTEGVPQATITVTRGDGFTGAVDVTYKTTSGTAVDTGPNIDYTGTQTGTISFADGETSKTIYININDDGLDEIAENFSVTLTGATAVDPQYGAASITSSDTTVVTIVDNDGWQLSTSDFSQDWTNTNQITVDDNVDNLQDITTASSYNGPVDIFANKTDPETFLINNVIEFETPDPTIALLAGTTASAPNLVIDLNTTGTTNINVSYDLRDLRPLFDAADGTVVYLEYRVGNGDWAYLDTVLDATTNSTIHRSITLPTDAEGQTLVQLRISTNAQATNEVVGVDNILVTASRGSVPLDLGAVSLATSNSSSNSEVTIGFTDSDTNESSYIIERSTDNFATVVTPVTTISRDAGQSAATGEALTYTDTTVSAGMQYQYRVRAHNASGDSNNVTVSITTLPSWVDAGEGAASWDSDTHTLSVYGAATVTADPGSSTIINVGDAFHAGATLTIAPTSPTVLNIHLGGLNLANGATATLSSVPAEDRSATNHRVLVVSGSNFLVDSTSSLDLMDNDLIVKNGSVGTATGGVYDGVQGYVQSGANLASGYWDGPGIRSSAAASNGAFTTALGTAAAGDLGIDSFDGEQVDVGDIVVKYTYYGDCNLDGVVDTDNDFSILVDGINGNFPQGGWLAGDYNYDGVIDADNDFSIFVDVYNNQGPQL